MFLLFFFFACVFMWYRRWLKHIFLIFEAEWKSEAEQLQLLANSEYQSFLFSCIIKFNPNSDFFLSTSSIPNPSSLTPSRLSS